jgi:hypothetical protein
MAGEACCWDEECPQHQQMREIREEEGYPVLIEEERSPGWLRRRQQAWDRLVNAGTIGTGGRALMDRAHWLAGFADSFMKTGDLPLLPLPDDPGYNGCQMVMAAVSPTTPGRIEFSAYFPGAVIVCWRKRPVSDTVKDIKQVKRKGILRAKKDRQRD